MFWNLLLLLREFDALINSPSFSDETLEYLQQLSYKLIEEWKVVASTESITFKMHFLTHYASHISNYGNLKRF